MTAGGASPVLVAGLGCRRGCPSSALLELIERHLADAGYPLSALHALASVDLKADEPGLRALAQQLDVPLICLPATTLAAFDTQLTHRSAIALARTGSPGVAESAALAVASQLGDRPAHLLVSHRKSDSATFALALAPSSGSLPP